ncbi:MAG: L-seryl-tRNA(Sec) selenium transferase [Chloroflexi bacterium]|nr:L-seryl-tRNA(Sec) selenium transferase [Chloroflexota bacterium]
MTTSNPYRDLPSVDALLGDERVRALSAEYSGDTVIALVREELDATRDAIGRGQAAPALDALVEAIEKRARAALTPTLRPAINATGVIIHTNLGRAPLSDETIMAMTNIARGYSNLEFDLEKGARGSRHTHLEEQLRRLTGAQAAMAVNNNAAAVLLALTALASGREVIISRSQLVEIGGGFRIPDVMAQSGARLVEIGTTNRTYLRDYEAAIGDETGALMRVHASNFKVVGFTASVSIAELATLARERKVALIDDVGSGCLLDTTQFGLPPEPTPQASLEAGADIVLFSGDKLLGGPQAGLIVGTRAVIEKLKHHPLARALRMDKASIAGLAATLDHYLKDEALEKIPVWRMIAMPVDDIGTRAQGWADEIHAGVIDGRSMIGGGSLPDEGLPTRLLAIPTDGGSAADALARRLRENDPPIIARIERDHVLLDPRTVDPGEDAAVIAALKATVN